MTNQKFLLPMMLSAFGLLVACDTVPIIKSDVEWNGRKADQECVHKAIENTPGVTFEKQTVRCAGSSRITTGDCQKRIFESFYAVNGNKKLRYAYVQFDEDEDGKKFVKNQNLGQLGAKFTDEDREGFRVALKAVNESLKKFCPDAGFATEPK